MLFPFAPQGLYPWAEDKSSSDTADGSLMVDQGDDKRLTKPGFFAI